MRPAVFRVFQFAFGCHHRRVSRVFTIKKRTYQVCCDCGKEFDYSWALMHPGKTLNSDLDAARCGVGQC